MHYDDYQSCRWYCLLSNVSILQKISFQLRSTCLDWSLFVCSTWRQTDPVPILEFKPVAAELALPALHVRLFLVELVNDDVKLSLQDVDLPFSKFLLAPPQCLLLTLLLQRCLGQLLLPWSQFLREGEQLKEKMLKAVIQLDSTAIVKLPYANRKTAVELPSPWSSVDQTFPGSPVSSHLEESGRTLLASQKTLTPRWLWAGPEQPWNGAESEGLGSSSLWQKMKKISHANVLQRKILQKVIRKLFLVAAVLTTVLNCLILKNKCSMVSFCHLNQHLSYVFSNTNLCHHSWLHRVYLVVLTNLEDQDCYLIGNINTFLTYPP